MTYADLHKIDQKGSTQKNVHCDRQVFGELTQKLSVTNEKRSFGTTHREHNKQGNVLFSYLFSHLSFFF